MMSRTVAPRIPDKDAGGKLKAVPGDNQRITAPRRVVVRLVLASSRVVLASRTGFVNSLALSADGKRLYSGGFDQTIRVWDVEAGIAVLSLQGHTGNNSSLVLSSDGKRLFSESDDKTQGLGSVRG
jgi:WD40 repeat protein